jgi:3-oxoacyl-[acyl-carrier-protein] synthase II
MRDVVITGMGTILNNCDRRDTFWQQLSEGRSQLRLDSWPDVADEPIVTGRIDDFSPDKYLGEISESRFNRYPRELQMYLASVFTARDDAGLKLDSIDPERVGVFDSSSRPGQLFAAEQIGQTNLMQTCNTNSIVETTPGMTAGFAASILKTRGPAYFVHAACSGGAVAIGAALREIQDGDLDAAFATGHENAVNLIALLQYSYRSRLQSSERTDPALAIRPFSRHGTVLGEGAITLVLESREHAESRGANIIAIVKGVGYGNCGGHVMRPDEEGVRPAEIIDKLLRKCNVNMDEVDFVVAHGNGVELSDCSEQKMMRRVFGQRSKDVPLVSNKPIYGHLLGASSAMNAAQAALMLKEQFVAPTINVDESRIPPDINHQAGRGAQKRCRYGLAVSFGMGGHNGIVLLGKYEGAGKRSGLSGG